MQIEAFKLNRKGQKSQRKKIELDQFIAFLATGRSIKMLRKKGRPTELFDTEIYRMLADQQRMNDKAVECRLFYYVYKGEGRKPSDRLRDEKGRPIREYCKPEDILGKIAHLYYYEGHEIYEYAKAKNIFFYEYEYNKMKSAIK